MAVNLNIPSQVKPYANLAAFPATGALKTIYIAEDTNKTYRWTGSVYVEISATAASTWGGITGTLSNQTDLQNALDAKVPTSRTLTINGVTQDLSANRTFSISTGITIGSTAIASGTVGRILFEGTGNVVQESSSLFWDNTNGRLGIGTSSPVSTFEVVAGSDANGIKLRGRLADNISNFFFASNDGVSQYGYFQHRSSVMRVVNNVGDTEFWNGPNIGSTVQRATLFGSTGNLAIGTTTDAGFRLDVNGTARVQTSLLLGSSLISASAYPLQVVGGAGGSALFSNTTRTQALNINLTTANETRIYTDYFLTGADQKLILGTFANRANQLVLNTTGNVGINTTTDAGFRLDVNGTARVQTSIQIGAGSLTLSGSTISSNTLLQIGGTGGTMFTQNQLYFANDTTFNLGYWIPNNDTRTGLRIAGNFTNAGAGATSVGTCFSFNTAIATSVGNVTLNNIAVTGAISATGGTTTYRGFYHNPTLTSMTGVTHFAFHSTSGRVRFENLPTSSAGLSAGDIWNDAGTLKIV